MPILCDGWKDDKEFAADNLCMNEPSFGDVVMCDHVKCTIKWFASIARCPPKGFPFLPQTEWKKKVEPIFIDNCFHFLYVILFVFFSETVLSKKIVHT